MAPMYDEDTGTVSSASYAIDDHAITKEDPSIFDTASGIITKGVPLTGLAIVNSFANTGIELSNWVTGRDDAKVSIQDEVGDGDLNDYYNEHSQGIEAAALAVGSLAPGLGAIKAGSIAVKAAFLAKEGLGSEAISAATGLLAPLKAKIVQGAMDELAEGTAGLYPSMALQKTTAIAQYSSYGVGAADNALQGMVYTAATAATMHASPLTDDQSLSDAVRDTVMGGVVGGVVGGLIEGIGTRGIFNKALLNASSDAKTYEAQARLGIGNYTAGDHIATIMDKLVDIHADDQKELSPLQAKTRQVSTDTAILAVRKIITDNLVDKGNEDVGTAVADMLTQSRLNGMNKDEIFEKTARLVKIDRFQGPDDIVSAAPDPDVIYINRYGKGDTTDQWANLVSNVPDPASKFSQRYAMVPGVTNVNIAHFSELFTGPNGESIQLYPTAKSAWDMNHDLFIDKKLNVHVNPDAPNIQERLALPGMDRTLTQKEAAYYKENNSLPPDSKKSLTGAPIVLNTKTGEQSLGGTQAVVGDFGKPKLVDGGRTLQYGDKFSSLNSPLDASTPTLDANARYVGMMLRRLKYEDTIVPSDLPMMEQLYREGTAKGADFSAVMKSLVENKGITFSDGSPLPSTADDLLKRITQEKQNLGADLLKENPKMGSDEIALRINSPESFVTSGFKAQNATDVLAKTEDHMDVNHVKLSYDIGAASSPDGSIQRGALDVAYRVQLGQAAAKDALASFAGENYDQFLINAKSTDAQVTGIGGGFLSSVNAAYGTIGQEAQRVGRMVTDFGRAAMSRVSGVMSPSVNAIRADPNAAAELGVFRAVRLNTGEAYTFLPADIAQKYGASENTAVLNKALVRDKTGQIVDWNKTFVPEGFFSGQDFTEEPLTSQYKPMTWYNLSDKVGNFERAQQQVNDYRLNARNNFLMAQGLPAKHQTGLLYTPPVDTTQFKHFAFVKNIDGKGMADDGVSVITAKTAEELQNKMAAVGPDFSVFTKDNLADYHKALGDYEYSRNFSQSQVNSALQSKGILNNILPDTRAETIISDYVNWNSKQEIGLIRDHVELGNAQLFSELRAMGERFQDAGSSVTGKVDNFTRSTTFNPYDSYIKTALGVSQKDTNYPLWAYANEKAEAFFSTAFKIAKNAFVAADKGMITYEDAAKMTQKFGLGNPYGAVVDGLKAYSDIANRIPDSRALSSFVSKANAIMGASVIRLDFWQQLIHLASSPMLMLSEAQSALTGKGFPELQKLLTTPLPDGTMRPVPATSKVLFNAVSNYFNKDIRDQWLPIYKGLGIIRDPKVIDEQFTAMNNLAFPATKGMWANAETNLKAAADWTAKYVTQSDNTNSLLHFMAADMGRQIFEAAGYEGKQLTDNIATFSNRVFGNFIASQRPVAFQGPIGQAVGLFQSYYYNFMQQAFRYVENGDAKSLAILGGMQSTLFGMQGTPGFSFINNHIIGNAPGNTSHGDVYSAVASLTGDRTVNDFVMYGAISSLTGAGLYTRGDLSPRSLTILPVDPTTWPSVRGAIAFTSNLLQLQSRVAQGGNLPSSLLLALEHNGLSRPLKGIAQLAQGYSTTAEGNLIASTRATDNTMGFSDMFSVANFSRLMSARPLDEAIAMDASYRSNVYAAKDASRRESLGEAVKSTLYAGNAPSSEQVENFTNEYAKAGGDIKHFNQSMMHWIQNSNASVANKVFYSLKNSPSAKNAMRVMGGSPLPDYMGSGDTQTTVSADATGESQ